MCRKATYAAQEIGLAVLRLMISSTLVACSIAGSGVAQRNLCHLLIVAFTSLAETFHHTLAILDVAVLAHLPLTLEARDSEAEAYDAPQHDFDEAIRRI